MTALTFAAIYFVVWWLCLFIVLPFGIRTQAEDEAGTVMGTAEGAPSHPVVLRKVIYTTLLAAFVVGALYFANSNLGLNIESISRWFE